MNRNAIIILIVIVLVFVGAAALIPRMNTPDKGPSPGASLIAVDNNASDHWVHSVAVIENVTKADGTVANIYIDSWIQPRSRIEVDLSEQLGYNGSIPAGTTMRMKMWCDPHSNGSGNATFNMLIHGGSRDKINDTTNAYLISASHILYKLGNITENRVKTSQDPTKGAEFLQGIKSIYVELLITVNQDGTMTITQITPPVLCNLAAGG